MRAKMQKKMSWTSSLSQAECLEVACNCIESLEIAPSHTQTCIPFRSAPGINH